MDLEDTLILGTLVIMGGCLSFGITKLAYSAGKVKEGTTKLLDAATAYLVPRVSDPADIQALAELARYRAEVNI